MAVTTTNLGVITAYGDAVAAGYTGTKAEWQALMASYATVGQQAVDAKNDAVAAKNTAVAKATEATTAASTATTKANEASASAQSIAQSAAQIQENTDSIDQLMSEIADMQSDGVVPSAEQILTDKGITDSVPYHYRATGGDGADRLYDQIVGGTVCFNQLFNTSNYAQSTTSNGITFTNNGDGTVTANGTATARANFSLGTINVISGHVYTYGTPDTNNAERWVGNSAYGVQNGKKYMEKETQSGLVGMNCMVASGTTLNNYVFKPQYIDLTAMFGSTVADYIYSLEQTTAGAGVAFFKSLFPNDYYPYNAGELVSVSGLTAHKMVEKNLFDKSNTANILIDADMTGDVIIGNSYLRAVVFIPCMPNKTYTASRKALLTNERFAIGYTTELPAVGVAIKSKSYVSYAQTVGNLMSLSVTTGNDAKYVIVWAYWDNTTEALDDLQIELGTTATAYKPYKAHSYPLDSTLTLRGIPKLVDGKMCFDGDTYDADGTVTRRYGVVDLGTLTWGYSTSDERFYTINVPVNAPTSVTTKGNIICQKYATVPYGEVDGSHSNDSVIGCIKSGNNAYVAIKDTAYTDATAFKTAMSGVMLVYELATPTTEEADPYQHLQQCNHNGTEEYVSTGIVPVGHNSFYPENLRAKVEGLPWNFANLIAPTESAFVATRNYTTGALFIVQNVLYKATSNIANGGTIIPNTNCTATTIAEIISALA